MPYGKRRRYIRRTGRRRVYGSSTRRRAFSRRVRAVVRREAETKVFVQSIVSSISTGSAIERGWVTGLGVGTGLDSRIGRKIRGRRIGFKIALFFNVVNLGSLLAHCRIVVIYPMKTISDASALTDLTPSDPGILGRVDTTKWLCLYDKYFTLYGVGAQVGGPQSIRFSFWKKWKGLFTFNNDGTINRQPLIYITTDLPTTDPSKVVVVGYMSCSFTDT